MNQTLNLATLIVACDPIVGRKKLQKIVHLLQIAGFRDQFAYEFGYLHYGPYSHGVKHDLDLLTSEGLVQEETGHAGEHTTFQYSASPDLASGLKQAGFDPDPVWGEVAKQLNGLSPQRLEAASTIAYLQDRGFADAKLLERFLELKPALKREFEDAAQLVGSLRR